MAGYDGDGIQRIVLTFLQAMARFTTQRSGSWSDTSGGTTPWSSLTGAGTGVPGDGDTIVVARHILYH